MHIAVYTIILVSKSDNTNIHMSCIYDTCKHMCCFAFASGVVFISFFLEDIILSSLKNNP